jgi:hypothetical protein
MKRIHLNNSTSMSFDSPGITHTDVTYFSGNTKSYNWDNLKQTLIQDNHKWIRKVFKFYNHAQCHCWWNFFSGGHCNLIALLKHLWITKLRTTYLWVLTFPLLDCSEFGNFVITLIIEMWSIFQQTFIKNQVAMTSAKKIPPAVTLV